MDAQRTAAYQYIAARPLIAEYTEIESGRKHTNRPQLLAALADCRKCKATLVIAKLDRLARVDMPQANRLTIHILAAVAEHEREMISQRTKAALAQANARGIRLRLSIHRALQTFAGSTPGRAASAGEAQCARLPVLKLSFAG